MQEKRYGLPILSTNPMPALDVGQIRGARLQYDKAGKPDRLIVSHGTPPKTQELVLQFGDAMFLLAILKSMQLDHKIPFPDDPRAPSARS